MTVGYQEDCLNDEKLQVVRVIQQFIRDKQEFDEGKAHRPSPLWLLLHGGPGTGKSYVVDMIVNKGKAAGFTFACMAPTGIAAANLPDGRTIHSPFGFNFRSSN